MPWRTMDVQEQRVEFVTAAKRGSQSFRSLCEEFGISRPTGYLRGGWRILPTLRGAISSTNQPSHQNSLMLRITFEGGALFRLFRKGAAFLGLAVPMKSTFFRSRCFIRASLRTCCGFGA